MEQLLRFKEKQVEFYFKKVNELISLNQELGMQLDSTDRAEVVKLDDQLVWEALESKEYKEIMARYEEHYGFIDEYYIPESETLGGLRYKLEESISEEYNLLPKYYNITNVLMWLHTGELKK